MKRTFFYVDAHAGSGKTHSLHNFVQKLEGFATIATQTNALSNQQANDLNDIGIKTHIISSETVSDNCTKQYVRHCTDRRDSVAILNYQVALQPLEDAKNQNLYIDEIFSPVEKFKLVEEHSASRRFFAELFCDAGETEFPGVWEILPTREIEEIALYGKSRKSSLASLQHVRDICNRANSPHYRVLVSEQNYEDFCSIPANEIDEAEEAKSNKKLTLFAWLQPSILDHLEHTPTIMGANFMQSKLALYWGDKVNFVAHPAIRGTRYEDFNQKARKITFRHMSNEHISSTFLDDKVGYDAFKDSLAKAVEAEYPGKEYLVTLSAKKDYKWSGENGTQISPNPLGLNGFQGIHMAVHAAPLNPSNAEIEMWKAVVGVSKNQLMIAQPYEMQYQMLTRTSVRDGKLEDDSDELVFIVLDLPSANHLRSVFGVDKPSVRIDVPALSNYRKPPRKTRSDRKTEEERHAVKMARQRERRAEKKAAEAAQIAYAASQTWARLPEHAE